MSNELMMFNFDDKNIRVILDKDNNPWFVGKDIAEALGYEKPANAIALHCDDAIEFRNLERNNNYLQLHPQTKLISKKDVIRLIVKSKKVNNGTLNSFLDMLVEKLDTQKLINNFLDNFELPDTLADMYVYAIKEVNTGNIKIGISKNPKERLKQLQIGNSSELILLGYKEATNRFKDERLLHDENKNYHIRGEWFSSDASIYPQMVIS